MIDDTPLAYPRWQYFSKLYLRWIDAKTTDRKDALLKCGYQIREVSE